MVDTNQQIADIVQVATDLLDVASGKIAELETAKQTILDAITADKSTWDTTYINNVNSAISTISEAQTDALTQVSDAKLVALASITTAQSSVSDEINFLSWENRKIRKRVKELEKIK